MAQKKILVIGVTASGKSRLAFELAKRLRTDIISVDSMKVYRKMDIGTAKPSPQRKTEVNYRLIDVVEPSESFSVDKYLQIANAAIADIQSQNKPVLAAGGTAMYIKALLHGLFEGPGTDYTIRERLKQRIKTDGSVQLHKQLNYVDPTSAQRIHPNDEKRLIRALEVFELTGKPISSFQSQFDTPMPEDWTVIGIRRDKEIESKRINARVKKMIDDGLVDEVKDLLAQEKPLSEQAACAIGYAEIIRHLNGEIELQDAIEQIKINTRKLAKAQRTWFKRFENVNWFDTTEETDIDKLTENILKIL